jgi:hypothetical protein
LKDAFADCQQCDCGPNPINNEPGCVNICCSGGGGGGDDDAPDCIMDCAFPSGGLNTDSGKEICQWITTSLFPAAGVDPCISDCATEIEYDNSGNSTGNVGEMLAGYNAFCEGCLLDTSGAQCNQWWDAQQGGGDQGGGPGGGAGGGGPDVNCGGFAPPATCSANTKTFIFNCIR